MALMTAPAARTAAAYEPDDRRVSDVVGSLSASRGAPRACCTIGVSGTGDAGGLDAILDAAASTMRT